MRQISVATSTGMFLRQCGGMIGVSIFGALLMSKLSESLAGVPGRSNRLGKMQQMAATSSGGVAAARHRACGRQRYHRCDELYFPRHAGHPGRGGRVDLLHSADTLRGRGPGQNLEGHGRISPAGR